MIWWFNNWSLLFLIENFILFLNITVTIVNGGYELLSKNDIGKTNEKI